MSKCVPSRTAADPPTKAPSPSGKEGPRTGPRKPR